jgi:hydroxymethylpyrimidine kinase/phosphomethylpyrimidine kinase
MTVAGSDSGGGAGIQADLKTFQARGVFGTSAISALTAQNTRGVRGVHTIPTQHLSDQMEAVLSDIGADVVKTGMLPTPEVTLLSSSLCFDLVLTSPSTYFLLLCTPLCDILWEAVLKLP